MVKSHSNVIALAIDLSKKLKKEVYIWLSDALPDTYWNVSPIPPIEMPYRLETVQYA